MGAPPQLGDKNMRLALLRDITATGPDLSELALRFAGIATYQVRPPMLRRNARPSMRAWKLRKFRMEIEGFPNSPLNAAAKLANLLDLEMPQ